MQWVLNSDCIATFIEPVSEVFLKLRKNYEEALPSSTRLSFYNIAMSDVTQKTTFFAVSDNAKNELGDLVPNWINQLGSVDREHILKHLDGILEPYIYEFEIETSTLDDFLESNNISKVDVLHIDAEGHDYRIFSTLNMSRYQPRIILIEYKHLDSNELKSLIEILSSNQYEITKFRSDILATKN